MLLQIMRNTLAWTNTDDHLHRRKAIYMGIYWYVRCLIGPCKSSPDVGCFLLGTIATLAELSRRRDELPRVELPEGELPKGELSRSEPSTCLLSTIKLTSLSFTDVSL